MECSRFRQRPATRALLLATVFSGGGGGRAAPAVPAIPGLVKVPDLPFEYSPEHDLYNQGKAVEYFEEHFYKLDRMWVLDAQRLKEAEQLRQRALTEPVLALAAAQVLYLYSWFRSSGEMIRENIIAAAQMFETSIVAAMCDRQLPIEMWVEHACDIRWTHAAMLYNWLGETETADAAQASAMLDRGRVLLNSLKEHPRYQKVGKSWTSPYHINFNSLRFPEAPSRMFWDSSQVPLARFLEEYHPIFKQELQAVIEDPRDLFEQLRKADGSKECLATPGGWDTVRIVRYGHWYDLFCEVAPATCELLRSRPEVNNCNFVNANYQKLYPNSHLKPHFGNAPRLAAHLAVIAPEPLRAAMSVGTDKTLWREGHVVVFDDTFPHAVSHWGSSARYVLNIWFCHPCDEDNAHGQTCPRGPLDNFG